IAVWVNPARQAGVQTILNKWYAPDSYNLQLDESNRPRLLIAVPTSRGGQATYSVTAVTALPVGRWSHVAATYDGKTLAIYVTGVLERQVTVSSAVQALQASTQPLVLGNRPTWNGYAGAIDDVRLYGVVLTPAQILALGLAQTVSLALDDCAGTACETGK